MGKDRSPNSAEIALPMSMLPVQSEFREKGKKNDCLAAVKINIFISIMAPKTKINTHIASVFSRDRSGLVRDRTSALKHVPLDKGTITHDCRGLLLLLSSGGRWYRYARGKGAILPKRGVLEGLGGGTSH